MSMSRNGGMGSLQIEIAIETCEINNKSINIIYHTPINDNVFNKINSYPYFRKQIHLYLKRWGRMFVLNLHLLLCNTTFFDNNNTALQITNFLHIQKFLINLN